MATFHHACISATDPDKSRQFYEALGFWYSRTVLVVRDRGRERQATGDEAPEVTNYWFGLGDQQSVLELRHEHNNARPSGHIGHIGLLVDDLDAVMARLSEQGFDDVESPPYQAMAGGGVFLALVRDPDRNLIELIGHR